MPINRISPGRCGACRAFRRQPSSRSSAPELAVSFNTPSLASPNVRRLFEGGEHVRSIHPARSRYRSIATGAKSMISLPSRKTSRAGPQALAHASSDRARSGLRRIPDGRSIRIRFSRPNEFGVLDHVVFAEGGAETRNAMRVVANGTGAEVMFTLLRTPGMTEEAFAADAAAVERDLKALKALLER